MLFLSAAGIGGGNPQPVISASRICGEGGKGLDYCCSYQQSGLCLPKFPCSSHDNLRMQSWQSHCTTDGRVVNHTGRAASFEHSPSCCCRAGKWCWPLLLMTVHQGRRFGNALFPKMAFAFADALEGARFAPETSKSCIPFS